MSTFGLIGLVVAFVSVVVSLASLSLGHILHKAKRLDASETMSWAGCLAALLAAASLTFCCAVMLVAFLTGDASIEYVVMERSDASGFLGTLYRISGLWAGREGSLMFWAWLISVFGAVVAVRSMKNLEPLDCGALFVMQAVLAAFVAVCLFSEANMPFIATTEPYIDEYGQLTVMGQQLGMNPLLEHWAQAIHPPTLFIGYAGLTVPFAYAISALITADFSAKWVNRCSRYAMFSWLLLGIGIGLGSIWAYVVLGWGGYWGWDPVENASLLSWMVALALVHSFTVYRKRGAFKRWSILCACLAFAFVITGTFITRSGIVQSVHAFEGDPVSLLLFGGLIAASVLAGLLGLAIRWKRFDVSETDQIQSLASREAMYYFNNVVMIVFTFALCYLTLSSALPGFLPFGGQSLSAGTYNAIARPLGIVYCLIIAVCPLLAWGRADKAAFLKAAKLPALCAGVLFVVLMAYFATTLYPAYNAVIAAGGTEAAQLASEGPWWYYNGLAVVGLAVASVLFFNTLFMICRAVSARAKAAGANPVAAFFGMLKANAPKWGGYIAHFAMSVILIGLIGSSMYVTESVTYVAYDEKADAADTLVVDSYELRFTGSSIEELGEDGDVLYGVEFDVYRAGTDELLGHVDPSVQLVATTQQTKLNASVLSFPTEDLFVVYRGVNEEGDLSMDVRVNPLISFVWVGFVLLMLGTAVAALGKRRGAGEESAPQETPASEEPADACAEADAAAPAPKEA